MSDRWRGILASLLNPDLRTALAEVILEDGGSLTPSRRARAQERLRDAGLLRDDGQGPRFDESAVRGILSDSSSPRATGPARFLDRDGRIARYPVRDADRRELLVWISQRAFRPGELLSEHDVNGRLGAFTDDAAALRRHLVDHELLERTRSGSEYAPVAVDE